jgi:hypothetical protein
MFWSKYGILRIKLDQKLNNIQQVTYKICNLEVNIIYSEMRMWNVQNAQS